MIPVSARARIMVQPERPAAPSYAIAPLTLLERTRLEAELYRLGARPVSSEDVDAELRRAAEHCLDAEDAQSVVAALDRYQQGLAAHAEARQRAIDAAIREHGSPEGAVEPPWPEDWEQVLLVVDRWRDTALRLWQPYADAVAGQQYYLAVYAQLLVRYGVRGWEGLEAPCVRRGDMLTEQSYQAIPMLDRLWLAGEVARLTRLDEGTAGNSGSPSS